MEVLTATLNPCIDRALYVDKLEKNSLVRSGEEFSIAGGKGANVARQLVRLGVRASAFVVVGGGSGKTYVDLVRRDGVRPVPYQVEQPTRWQMTFIEKQTGNYHTVLQEAKPVPRRHEAAIIKAIVSEFKGKNLLVLSGSSPGPGLSRVYKKVIERANKKDLKVILDTYGTSLREGTKASPYVVKPNKKECEDLLGSTLRTDADFRKAYTFFHKKGISLVVISLGERGLRASFKGFEYIVSSPKVREINPVASGDALVAGITYGLLGKLSIEESLRWGVAAGAANAAEWAVANCSRTKIRKLLAETKIRQRACK